MQTYLVILFISAVAIGVAVAISGTGTTTRYWDCCKPSCSWKENVGTLDPVASCSADGVAQINASARSGCDDDGVSYVCNNLQPWAVNDSFAYGFVAASFVGSIDNSRCCTCLRLTFLNALAGKTFVVQNVNTGADLHANHFDVQMPGSGVGSFTRGCHTQWNAPWSGWGQQYGGISSIEECNQLPEILQPGCRFRFEWYQNADNPQINFEQITSPDELISLTGCVNNNFN